MRFPRNLTLAATLALVACSANTPPPPAVTAAPANASPPSPPPPSPSPSQASVPAAEPPRAAIDPSTLNTSVAPCDDFYEYACGTWLKTAKIPDDHGSWTRGLDVIDEENKAKLREILERDAKGEGDDPYAKQLGDYYAACMDEDAVEKSGLDGLKDELARIDAAHAPADLTQVLGHLHSIGIGVGFSFDRGTDNKNSTMQIGEFSQGGLGLPERDYYLKTDAKSKELRAKYLAHVARMLELLGEKPSTAKADATSVLAFETKLAKASMPLVDLRDSEKTYHKIDLKGLRDAAPAIDWTAYFAALGTREISDINVDVPPFAAALSGMVKSTPLTDWKAYLRFHLISAEAASLTKAVVDEDFHFNRELSGQAALPPRWKRCVGFIDETMGEALAIPFVKTTLGETGKKAVHDLVSGIEVAMKANLAHVAWMDEGTRARALEKVSLVANMLAFPDKWRSYDRVEINRASLAKSLMSAVQVEIQRRLAGIGQKVDKNEWGLSPPTVNAYYDSLKNQMVFPAGILRPPFFGTGLVDAVNFGSIGFIIGHELTHGFDDDGRKFDKDGNMQDWWTKSAAAEFQRRSACVTQQFDEYVAVDELHINGKQTLGENIADLGGMKLAHAAYRAAHASAEKVGGFTDDQQFFLGFAQGWCTIMRPEEARTEAQSDVHSPPRFRVNGTLSNTPEFAQAFSCPDGSKMMRPKGKRCEVW